MCDSAVCVCVCVSTHTHTHKVGAKYSGARGDASHAPNHRRRSEKAICRFRGSDQDAEITVCFFSAEEGRKPSSFSPGCDDRDEVISTPRQESYGMYMSIQ